MTKQLTPDQTAWIAALRSGKYSQTTAQLEDPDTGGMCCLGVGCALFLPTTRNEIIDEEDDAVTEVRYGYKDEADAELAPDSLVRKLGLRNNEGSFEPPEGVDLPAVDGTPREARSLAELNDAGWTFIQIADFVEAYPEAVFT